jgi:hypothetical protein
MLKALLLSAVLFSSCAGFAARRPVSADFESADKPALWADSGAGYLVSGPGAGTLTVIGVSGRMRTAEREIDRALDDAARQIALYHGLKGKATTVLETGAGYRDFYLVTESEFKPLDEGDYTGYREALRFDREKDLVRTGTAVFLRCVYDAPGLGPVGHTYGAEDGEPAWLHGDRTEIPGYISAAGFSKNHRYLTETIARSRESAAAALLATVSSHIETRAADHTIWAGTTGIREIVEGELHNFMVLETWIEPGTGSVWTLAAARKIQKEAR